MTTTALVTGAAGLLGRATVDALADAGVEVHALVRSADQAHRDDVVFHPVDLSRPIDTGGLPAKIDAVYHLAQAREFRDFPDAALTVFSINVASTAVLLDYAHRAGASNFVYASSGGVYAGQTGVALTEDVPVQEPARLGYYIATKVSSEALVGSYSSQFSTAVLRYFFIYGPDQARGMLIPRLYDRVRGGEPLSLQGDRGMSINPVHVRDAAAATVAAGGLTGAHTLNVAGPEVLSLADMGELFARDLDTEAAFDRADGTPVDLIASVERMGQLLVAPTISLGDALSDVR